MCQLFGKRQGLAYQTGHTLPESIVEAFDVIGFPRVLRDGFVPLRWNHACVGVLLIRMEDGLFLVDQRNLGPERFGTLTTAITHVKRNDLAGDGVHSDPDPLLVGFPLHKAPHLVGFGFQPAQHHVRWTLRQLDVQVIRTSRKALHHKVQEPREADTHGTADPTQ